MPEEKDTETEELWLGLEHCIKAIAGHEERITKLEKKLNKKVAKK